MSTTTKVVLSAIALVTIYGFFFWRGWSGASRYERWKNKNSLKYAPNSGSPVSVK